MFSKIAVALNDLPESQRVLRGAIDLALACKSELNINMTSIYPIVGVPFTTSHKRLPAAYSVCIENISRDQRSLDEMDLASEALRNE